MKLWHWLFLAAFVFILRLPYFNSPAIHIDEQFYLVVADKWVNQGQIPYIEIWDRKPIGIFAIFAAAVLLFKNAILGYQLLATLFVVATCGVIYYIARLLSAGWVPLLAAMVYGVGVMLWEGQGGQTPVFYNLFVGAAVAILFGIAATTPPSRRDVVARMLAASLLFGVSLQIKYTCVIEASALSLYVLGILYTRKFFKLSELAVLALGMMLCGLFPTVVVGAIYGFIGHWPEFFEANFVSIFEKHTWNLSGWEYFRRFRNSSLFGIIFLPLAAYGLWKIVRGQIQGTQKTVLYGIVIWIFAAFVGALMFGNPTQHYFLPTVMPLALLVSLGFWWLGQEDGWLSVRVAAVQKSVGGYGGFLAVLLVPCIASYVMSYSNAVRRGEASDLNAVGAYMREHRSEGCAFVFNRLPILYYLGQACALSSYVFPNHLSEMGEVQTPDRKRFHELERVLASTPAMIFVRRPHTKDTDLDAIDMLEQTLRDRYALAMERQGYRQVYQIYRPLPRTTPAPSQ